MRQNDTPDVPDGVRILTDGGVDTDREPDTKHSTVEVEGVVSRDVKDEEREVLRVPISSTRADREGDRFAKEALEDMAEQIRDEQPLVFQNHGLAGSWMDAIPYDQAESIGTHFDAEVSEADDGEHELFALINPDKTHPEGERMLKQVRDEGQSVKFSVGFGIQGYDDIEDDAGNVLGREFTAVDLMENSKVGIPANPDASVSTASAKSGVPAMHPMMQMMQQMSGQSPDEGNGATPPVATKDGIVTDGGTSDVDALRSEVAELRDLVEEVLEDDGDDDDEDEDDDEDGKNACDVDTDCPEGEVCIEGECVPEDDVDDDGEDEESASADADLREKVAELEKALDDGHGESKTGDPTVEDPPTEKTEEPDETSESSEPSGTSDHDHIL